MTCSAERSGLFSKGRRGVLFAALALWVGGCATGTIEDAVPQGALPPPATPAGAPVAAPAEDMATAETAGSLPSAEAASAPAPVADSTGAPRLTGTYPNLNIPPRAAAEQLAPGESRSLKEELREKQRRQRQAGANGAPPPVQARQLEELGRSHADEVLREIEGE